MYIIETDNGPVEVRDYSAINWQELNKIAAIIHEGNSKWWHDPHTGEPIKRNVGELLMLVTSELSEAMEGDRKKLKDDHLPHRDMFEVEIMDAFIRLFDLVGGLHLNFQALIEKHAYNAVRADHKHENRIKEGGKAY